MTGGKVADLVERRLVDAETSLERAREALERNRGNLTEPDWQAQVDRAEARLVALVEGVA